MAISSALQTTTSLFLYQKKVGLEDPYLRKKFTGLFCRVCKNFLFQISCSTVTLIVFSALVLSKTIKIPIAVSLPIIGSGMIALTVIIVLKRKKLWHAFALTFILLMNSCGYYPWWNQLDDLRTLSALPRYEHVNEIFKSVPVGKAGLSVMSFTQDFETASPNAMQSEDWAHYRIPHVAFKVTDLTAPSLSQIKAAIEWSTKQHLENRHVLYHCNAGIGRSATIVLCELMHRIIKEKRMPLSVKSDEMVDLVIKQLKTKRKWLKITPVQRKRVVEFIESEIKQYTDKSKCAG